MYEDRLLQLSRDTRFRHSEPLSDPVSERRNPACGDEIALTFDLEDNRVRHLQFHAQGCAVSVAAATALCLHIEGQTPAQASERVAEALAFFAGDAEWTAPWGHADLPALGAVRARPMRMACVRLPWEAMRTALESA